jgi:hypothetical protein
LHHNKTIGDKVMAKELYCFEVETTYKSGRKRSEIIVSTDEENMLKWYDKHHNKKLFKD